MVEAIDQIYAFDGKWWVSVEGILKGPFDSQEDAAKYLSGALGVCTF